MPGIRDLLAGISSGTRNLVQRIPGGSRAFPLESNGTVNWLGDPMSGNNVVGAIGRDLSGYGMVEGLIGGGSPSSGSVVGRGFVGGSVPRPNAIRQSRASGVPRIDSVIPRNEQAQRARDEVNPRVGSQQGSRPAGGGRSQLDRSTAHVTGGDVSMSEHIRRQGLIADRER